MRSQDSALPPSAAARRSAISALTAARPLMTRESATRDTCSRRANSVTFTFFSTVSRKTSPGCGGLCIRLIAISSVVIHVVHEHGVLAFEGEYQPPVAAYRDCPVALEFALEGVKA